MCKCSGKCGCNITSTTKGPKGDSGLVSNYGYKVFKASLSQTGTDAPFVEDGSGTPSNPFINTIGTITLSRTGTGLYNITSSSLFTLGKTWYSAQASSIAGVNSLVIINYVSASSIIIQTYTSGVLADDVLNQSTVSIEVYP